VNRTDFQQLAELRAQEARILFQADAFAGAFYLAGYAVECALKACVAKRTREFDFHDKDVVKKSYTHNLIALLEVSNVGVLFEEAKRADATLETNWGLVRDWAESSRYELGITEQRARAMLTAMDDESHGVLTWLKKYW
jgi:hypothetical protein